MHGLINRAIERFVCDTYGVHRWQEVAARLDPFVDTVEAMMTYDNQVTYDLVDSVCKSLNKSPDMVLEDVGTYLVSHPNCQAIRRLLRFGGDTFTEFLHSLDDLPDRGRLAVPELELPYLELRDHAPGQFSLRVGSDFPGFGAVMMGIMRAMADDYGALVIMEHKGRSGRSEMIDVSLLDTEFAQGKSFSLGPADDASSSGSKESAA